MSWQQSSFGGVWSLDAVKQFVWLMPFVVFVSLLVFVLDAVGKLIFKSVGGELFCFLVHQHDSSLVSAINRLLQLKAY